MLKIEFTNQFKKDYKLALKRGFDAQKLKDAITILCNQEPLPDAYRDHTLVNSRNYIGVRECHLEPDTLLIYRSAPDQLLLKLIRMGSRALKLPFLSL